MCFIYVISEYEQLYNKNNSTELNKTRRTTMEYIIVHCTLHGTQHYVMAELELSLLSTLLLCYGNLYENISIEVDTM